jgi:hypothetical protein
VKALSERDERFVQAYSAMYANFAICLLNAAARISPRSVCTRLALVAFDMAKPIGGVVAAVYASVRGFGDLVRWMLRGS